MSGSDKSTAATLRSEIWLVKERDRRGRKWREREREGDVEEV